MSWILFIAYFVACAFDMWAWYRCPNRHRHIRWKYFIPCIGGWICLRDERRIYAVRP
jgi:hypothetical protein